MYGTLRSSKVLEILQIIKHINYSNLSASRRRIFFGDACTEIAMKFALRIYDFIEQESAYSFLNCPDPSHFNEFFFHPPTLSHFLIKT